MVDVKFASGNLFEARRDVKDLLRHILTNRVKVRSRDAAEFRFVRNDIRRVAAVDAAYRENYSFKRVYIACRNLLQQHDRLTSRQNRVLGQMRGRAVSALSFDRHVVKIHRCGQRPCVKADFTDFLIRKHMHAEDRVNVRVLQSADLHEFSRTARQCVLAVLEDQLDGSREFIFVRAEQLGGSQQHGNMHIMSAGVHHTGLFTAVRQSGLFCDRQGVDIRAKRDTSACALASMNQTDDRRRHR